MSPPADNGRRGPVACRLLAAAVAGVAMLAGAGTAQAVTCDYAQSGQSLEVRIQDSRELVAMDLEAGVIRVFDYITPVVCTSNPPGLTPTVTNTNVIAIAAEPGVVGTNLTIDDAPGFAPGPTPDPGGGSSEIEIFANLRDPVGSRVSVRSGSFPGSIRFGTSGINTNATPGEILPDRDITLSNTGPVEGKAGNDTPTGLDASGGAATGGALTDDVYLVGSSGAETLVGGDGDDELFASSGSDVLRGGAGADLLQPGLGGDTVEGGPGVDTAAYLFQTTSGIVVDLARSGPQATVGAGTDSFDSVENIQATTFADVLSGDDGPNDIFSSNGNDSVDGRGGADAISTGAGADTIQTRDGVRDVIDCGADIDTVIADVAGLDSLTGCENVDFAPAPPAPPAPGGGATGAGAGAGSALTAPVVRGLRVAPRALAALASGASVLPPSRRTGGASVSFMLDRAAAVTFTVRRVVVGRRAGARCAPLRRANRAAPRCARLVAVRGAIVRRTGAGAGRFRFSGRLGGRALPEGSYRLRATPRADGMTGATVSAAFRIAS
jgi:hypothetical protein